MGIFDFHSSTEVVKYNRISSQSTGDILIKPVLRNWEVIVKTGHMNDIFLDLGLNLKKITIIKLSTYSKKGEGSG